MELGILVGRNPFPLDARLGPADLPQLGADRSAGPTRTRWRGRRSGHPARRRRRRTGLEQGLTFPDLGPAVVVGRVGVNASGLRALSAFGPQRRVHPVHAGGRRGSGQQAYQGGGRRLRLGGGLRRPPPGRRIVDEQQVEVAVVGQLPPPEASHADDRERQRRIDDPRGRPSITVSARSVSARPGGVDPGQVEHVAGGDAQHLRPHEELQAPLDRPVPGAPGQRAGHALVELGPAPGGQSVARGQAGEQVRAWRSNARAKRGPVPSSWHSWRAASGDSRHRAVS